MAQWLANLKSILHVDLSGVKEIRVSMFSGNRDSRNGLIHIENVDNSKRLTINISSEDLTKDSKKRAQLLSAIKEASLESAEQPLLEVHASQEIEAIISTESDDDLPEFFRGKVPDVDIPILKAAAYIRQLHEKGQPVKQYKEELRERYGKHADNITNLYTAGYFETHIKPMYEELARRPNFNRQLFIENYEILVDGAPFAVFVKQTQTRDDLITEVAGKIATNKSYGVKTLSIHAIGDHNVKLLNDVLKEVDIVNKFTDPPSITAEGYAMIARIFF